MFCQFFSDRVNELSFLVAACKTFEIITIKLPENNKYNGIFGSIFAS